MVSGHRRKAAYALLAKDDPAYERMPCRVIEGIDDERAVTLLHAANYFTRALTVTERAAATEALRGDAVRLRSEDPSLSGMRVILDTPIRDEFDRWDLFFLGPFVFTDAYSYDFAFAAHLLSSDLRHWFSFSIPGIIVETVLSRFHIDRLSDLLSDFFDRPAKRRPEIHVLLVTQAWLYKAL